MMAGLSANATLCGVRSCAVMSYKLACICTSKFSGFVQGNLQRARVIRSRKQKFTILDNVSGTLTPVSPCSLQTSRTFLAITELCPPWMRC